MYEKIATSLSSVPGYEVHVAGFAGAVPEAVPVHFHPLFRFKRLALARFLAPWKFYKLLIKVKPQYIIATTHDLLTVTCIYKILFGGKIIYDVQENYFRNIASTPTFPPLIRNLLAGWIRLKEIITRPLISHYFLAERNYEKEFSFTKGKSTILENKTRKSSVFPRSVRPENRIRLLYSGTISPVYGVYEAVDLAVQLHRLDPRIELSIIGYAARDQVFNQLSEKIAPYPFIKITGGNKLVPHTVIMKEISRSDFGLICYRPNKSTINCIPTKLYEYLASGLPVLVSPNPLWVEMVHRYSAGLVVDFQDPDPVKVLSAMTGNSLYTGPAATGIFWEDEEEKLLHALNSIL